MNHTCCNCGWVGDLSGVDIMPGHDRRYICPRCNTPGEFIMGLAPANPASWWRFEESVIYGVGPRIQTEEYQVVTETSCGVWLRPKQHLWDDKVWVSKTAKKRFAYPTKEQALENLMARKQRQIAILEDKLQQAKTVLWITQDLLQQNESSRIAPTVVCKLCDKACLATTAHHHRGEWVGDECCWDERLRATE